MTIEFHCPHCDKTLKTSEDKSGRQAKCPGCGEVIDVPRIAEGTSETEVDTHESVLDQREVDSASNAPPPIPPPIPPSSDDRVPCPACGGQIKANAIRCRFCGKAVDGVASNRHRTGIRRDNCSFSVDLVISETWRMFSEQTGLLVGAFLVTNVLVIVGTFVALTPMALADLLDQQGNAVGALAARTLGLVLCIASAAFTIYLRCGYLVLQLKAARDQPVEIGDLFTGGRFCVRLVLNAILVGLIVALGYFACFVPGILLSIMLFPFAHALVDEDCPGIDCLIRAKQLTDGNWGSLFLIFVFAFVAAFAGLLACGVGLIFAYPFVDLLFAVTYIRLTYETPK